MPRTTRQKARKGVFSVQAVNSPTYGHKDAIRGKYAAHTGKYTDAPGIGRILILSNSDKL